MEDVPAADRGGALTHRILHAWQPPGPQFCCSQQRFTLWALNEGSRQWESQPYIPKDLRGLGIKTLRSSFHYSCFSLVLALLHATHFPDWTLLLLIWPGWCNRLIYMVAFPVLGRLLVMRDIRDESDLNCMLSLSIHNCTQAEVLYLLDCSGFKSRCIQNWCWFLKYLEC